MSTAGNVSAAAGKWWRKMPKVKYPGLNRMAEELGKMLNKHPAAFRNTILSNVKHLLENIPPEELLSIFEEDEENGR